MKQSTHSAMKAQKNCKKTHFFQPRRPRWHWPPELRPPSRSTWRQLKRSPSFYFLSLQIVNCHKLSWLSWRNCRCPLSEREVRQSACSAVLAAMEVTAWCQSTTSPSPLPPLWSLFHLHRHHQYHHHDMNHYYHNCIITINSFNHQH